MRWSKVKLGLSGTSLVLAVGCSEPAIDVDAVAETVLEEVDEAEERAEVADRKRAEEAAIQDRLESERRAERLASGQQGEAGRQQGAQPWFLRPAGDVAPASTQAPPSTERQRPITNQEPRPVVANTSKPVNSPPGTQTINNRKGWGWTRPACGRG